MVLGVVGCADGTAIIVSVDGSELSVPGDIDSIRIRAVGETSGLMASLDAPVDGTWPQTLAIRPGDASSSETVEITVEGLLAGAVRVRRSPAPLAFVAGSELTLPVPLTRACLGIGCPPGVDCDRGMCIGIPDPDAGVDMGVDTGVPDTGGMDTDLPDTSVDTGGDAGDTNPPDMSMDTGPEDTGPMDTGTDTAPDLGPPDMGMMFGDVFFSEYVEGSGSNKAIEIYNARATPVDLGACMLELYINGSATPDEFPLSGMLPSRMTRVLCNNRIDGAAECDVSDDFINHNGDDAYVLRCGGTIIDSFGAMGDPGTAWTGGGISSAELTLRRKPEILRGSDAFPASFDPSLEWDPHGRDTFDGLGER